MYGSTPPEISRLQRRRGALACAHGFSVLVAERRSVPAPAFFWWQTGRSTRACMAHEWWTRGAQGAAQHVHVHVEQAHFSLLWSFDCGVMTQL